MAKINSTYNAGYRFDHDFDVGKAAEAQKRLKKQRTAEEIERESVNRQTMMLPVGVVCGHCDKRIGKSTKVYANVKKLGKERKYLGKLAVYSLTFRCVFCSGKIVLETDPENRDYKVVSGGTRVMGDWKELRDEALAQEQSKAELLKDENTRQAALLEESQRQAAKAEELTKFLTERSKMNLDDRITSALSRVQQEKGASSSGDRFADMRGRPGPTADDGEPDDDEFVFDEAEWLEAQKACGGIIAGVVHPPGVELRMGEGNAEAAVEDEEEFNPFVIPDIAGPANDPLVASVEAALQLGAQAPKSGTQSISLTLQEEAKKEANQTSQADEAAVAPSKKPKRSALSRLLE
jgi:hypothetical protein